MTGHASRLCTTRPAMTPLTGAAFAMTTSALRTTLAITGFLLVVGFLLTTEHRAHVFGFLPFLLLLACPLLHVFLHRGHGGHGSDHSHDGARGDRPPAAPDEQPVADARRGRGSPHRSSPPEAA